MLSNQRCAVHLDNSAQQGCVHSRAFSQHDADVRTLRLHHSRHGGLPLYRPVFVQVAAAAAHGAGVADILWVRRADESLATVQFRRHVPDHQVTDDAYDHRYPVHVLWTNFLSSRQANTGLLFLVVKVVVVSSSS